MSEENKPQEIKTSDVSSEDVGTGSTSSANASNSVHPHRRRNITIGVIIAVVIVAIIACILVFAHPWDTDNVDDTGALGSAMESSQQVNDAEDSQDKNKDNAENKSDIPTVPDEWISDPDEFDSEEDAARFKEGEWHTDGNLQGKYGFKIVTTEDGSEYVAGELIVVMPLATADEDVISVAQYLGGDVAEIHDSEIFDERRVTIVFSDNADIEKLAKIATDLNGVRSAHANSVGSISEVDTINSNEPVQLFLPNDSYISSQGYLTQSRFIDAWDVIRCDGSVTVAVLDSGVSLSHIDLSNVVDAEHAWDVIEEAPLDILSSDENGHGTAVSGVIAAEAGNGRGIAGASYNAVILPVRMINQIGFYNDEDLIKAFDYLFQLDKLPDVINMSFSEESYNSELLARINQASITYGIVCVAAVGNYSSSDSAYDSVRYPAGFDEVIGVGAVTASNKRCSFSNVNSSVDVCALGQGVYTTSVNGSYGSMTGTSLSTPQVSAATALLKAQNPYWSPYQVKEQLISTAVDLGDAGRDDLYGYGLLDAAAAVGYTSTGDSGNSGGSSGGGSGWSGGDVFWSAPASAASVDGYLTAYAVRDGSAGPDFLGISNTNFDFTDGFLYY